MSHIEIALWFGDTLVDVHRVARGGRLRVGAGRGVDLPLDLGGIEDFDLVTDTADGPIVRCPASWSAPPTPESESWTAFMVRAGAPIDVRYGQVRIRIAIAAAIARLPRTRIDPRPLSYLAASLVVQISVVLAALATAELERLDPGEIIDAPPLRIARLPAPGPPPPPPAPTPPPSRHDMAASATRSDPGEPRPVRSGREGGPFAALHGLRMIDPARIKAGLEGVTLYDEDAANAAGFGGAMRKFDPSQDPAFDSVKSGPYATVSTGRGAGAHYKLPGEVGRPPTMALTCDDDRCVVEGSMNRHQVRDVIESNYPALLACYDRHASAHPRVDLTLRFQIDPDGTATGLEIEGLPAVATCVQRLVQGKTFPPRAQATRVHYPMAFWRNASS